MLNFHLKVLSVSDKVGNNIMSWQALRNGLQHISRNLNNLTSAEMRKYCYEFDKLQDYMKDELDLPLTVMESGSSTEACGKYSDIDRMLYSKDFVVIESAAQIREEHAKGVLLADTTDCHPGYCRLKLERRHPCLLYTSPSPRDS